jgi:hypothetical protein
MSVKRLVVDGYGQLELNQVAFRRDGRIEAQCKLDSNIDYVENGMLLAVDKANKKIKMPTGSDDLIALNYTTEHMYDERDKALKNFRLDKNSFLPRLGYLSAGDRFTSNCIAYDDSEFATEDLLKAAVSACATTPLYGKECSNGAILLTATKPTGLVCLRVVGEPHMPDGTYGVKFISLK